MTVQWRNTHSHCHLVNPSDITSLQYQSIPVEAHRLHAELGGESFVNRRGFSFLLFVLECREYLQQVELQDSGVYYIRGHRAKAIGTSRVGASGGGAVSVRLCCRSL